MNVCKRRRSHSENQSDRFALVHRAQGLRLGHGRLSHLALIEVAVEAVREAERLLPEDERLREEERMLLDQARIEERLNTLAA